MAGMPEDTFIEIATEAWHVKNGRRGIYPKEFTNIAQILSDGDHDKLREYLRGLGSSECCDLIQQYEQQDPSKIRE